MSKVLKEVSKGSMPWRAKGKNVSGKGSSSVKAQTGLHFLVWKGEQRESS